MDMTTQQITAMKELFKAAETARIMMVSEGLTATASWLARVVEAAKTELGWLPDGEGPATAYDATRDPNSPEYIHPKQRDYIEQRKVANEAANARWVAMGVRTAGEGT